MLEVGVDTSKLGVHYPENLDVTGIDFSPNVLTRAKKAVQHKDNVRLMEMDAEQLTLEDNCFDTDSLSISISLLATDCYPVIVAFFCVVAVFCSRK